MTDQAEPSQSPAEPRLRWPRLLPWIVFCVACLVYANTLPNGLVFDDTHTVGPDATTDLGDWSAVFGSGRRVVGVITLALNHAVHGDEPAGYHAVNMLIHAAAAAALYGLVLGLLGTPRLPHRYRDNAHWFAFVLALVWAVHPLNTQAVAYMIQRYESLMGLFFLLTLLFTVYFARAPKQWWWAVLAVLSCVLGMATKEVMVAAPLVALLLDRRFYAGSLVTALRSRWYLYVGLFGCWLVFVALGVTDVFGEGGSAGFGSSEKVTPIVYLFSQGNIILHYLRLSVVPYPLVLDYGWQPSYPDGLWLPGVIVVAAGGIATAYGLWRNRWWAVLAGAFFLILAPTSSIMPIGDLAFEHRMYLPLICVLALIIFGGFELVRRLASEKRAVSVGTVVAAVAIPLFATLTVVRNFEYASALTIWTTVVQRAPENARGYYNLGRAHEKLGDWDLAEQRYAEAVRRAPGFEAAHYGLGGVWLRQARAVGAGRARQQLAHDAEERFKAAVDVARLKGRPADTDTLRALAEAMLLQRRVEEAGEVISQVIDRDPDDAKAYEVRARVRMALGEVDAGLEDFRNALRAEPDYQEGRYNYALALHHSGRLAEAAEQYQAYLMRDPENVRVLLNLARIRATAPDPAARSGREALRLMGLVRTLRGPHDQGGPIAPAVLDTLAAAYAESGDFEHASQAIAKAMQLAKRYRAPESVLLAMQVRRTMYAERKPYREGGSGAAGSGSE